MITGVAIKYSETEFVSLPKPNRHCDVMRKMIEDGHPKPITGEQGFVSCRGFFLSREAAWYHVATLEICLDERIFKGETRNRILFSEDLW